MECRVCSNTSFELVLDLGNQPWCNHFLTKAEVGTEPHYPLRLVYCLKCATSQLDYTVKKEVMFGNHTYLSGITKTLDRHFKDIAHMVHDSFYRGQKNLSVLDIGSNDGTQLKHFRDLGYEVLGVESSVQTAKIAQEQGIQTLNAFYNLKTQKEIAKEFDVINASGVFFHLEELHSVCDAVRAGLKENGVFVVQFLYMKTIMENNAFDQIYHEHLLYYTLQTLQTLLSAHGLEIFDSYLSAIHGGSMIAFVGHPGKRTQSDRFKNSLAQETRDQTNTLGCFKSFAKRVEELKQKNRGYLLSQKNDGKLIYGMGAPVKGNTLLNYFDIGPEVIPCLVEKNSLRKGLYSPGKHIPVVMEDEIKTQPDVYYVLAWNFRKEILERYAPLISSGVDFYFPIVSVLE